MIWGAWLCLLAPLGGALLVTLMGTRWSRRGAAYAATSSTALAFVGACVSFFSLWAGSGRHHLSTAYTWLGAGSFHSGMAILVDPLSTFMMLVVSGVGSLIVAYSIGYMDGDEEERRYFAYMALFVFSMLLLGFWHQRPSAVAAAKKAFIMNAFGDATMALALFLLIQKTGSLDYAGVFARAPHGGAVANLVALGLLG